MKISQTAKRINPSLTRKLFNMAKNFDDVIDLTLGDPDLEPPRQIRNAACESINANKSHYSANAGLMEARIAISEKLKKDRGLIYSPNSEILLTVGGMEALYLTFLTILDRGDEVVVFSPYYVNYIQMIEMCGARPVVIDVYDKNGFNINPTVLEAAITGNTVAIVINSPNNPTGETFNEEQLKIIATLATKYDLTVISDEVYKTLLYDNCEHKSILQLDDMKKRTVLIDSLSKEYSMTGWRVGYAVAPQIIIENMTKLQENVAACTSLPSQYALIEAYTNDVDNKYIVNEFQKRRDYLFEKINSIHGLSCNKPKGTFYAFVNIECTHMDCMEFAYSLLEQEHVAVVPGIAYGKQYSGYIRIAFTREIDVLAKAMERIERFCNE